MEPDSEYSNLNLNMKPGVELRGIAKEDMEFNKFNNYYSDSISNVGGFEQFNKDFKDYSKMNNRDFNTQFKINFSNKNLNQNERQPNIPMSYYFSETGASSINSLVNLLLIYIN
jgi:hypothetical protein